MFSDLPLKEFIEELSSSNPTPGGGAASAIVGAFGFALVSMVLSIRQKKNPDAETELLIKDAKEKLNLLIELSSKDAKAFDHFMEALELPKESEEQKEIRKRKIQEALKESTIVPFEVINVLYEGSKMLNKVKELCPKSAISDLYTAIGFFEASFEGAKSNVLINLQSVKDEKFVLDINSKLSVIESELKSRFYTLKDEIYSTLKIKEA
ncbi:cyclodeaminase/cyclohydrolase family protein [Caldisericum exile]|uniref:cyclodeaminase/cyclohydrolase family protein n=1 Tax=Caldisericum exile TaxID=693075 RepID=UPI003C74D8A1